MKPIPQPLITQAEYEEQKRKWRIAEGLATKQDFKVKVAKPTKVKVAKTPKVKIVRVKLFPGKQGGWSKGLTKAERPDLNWGGRTGPKGPYKKRRPMTEEERLARYEKMKAKGSLTNVTGRPKSQNGK